MQADAASRCGLIQPLLVRFRQNRMSVLGSFAATENVNVSVRPRSAVDALLQKIDIAVIGMTASA
jgi:hypothetical protein